jgi:diacylglycerol O-acyltransferase / wax synthase
MTMKQLSGLDATFLYLETPQMPMHVGALHILELPEAYKGRFVRDLRKHVASRLPAAPVLRRRVWWMPLNLAAPAWVDAEPDLNKHIVEIGLPKAGKGGDALAALEAQVSALHPVLLDRSRPLWKMHVFEGLPPSASGHKRVGLYTQLHHAAVDGQAAVALANVLLDVTPQARQIEARPSRRPRTFKVDMAEMLRGALANELAQITKIVKSLPSTVGTLTGAAKTVIGASALMGGRKSPRNVTLAPATPFNVSVTEERAFAAVTLPLRELKVLGRAHGATVNDMVLMLCSSALRRHFAKKRTLPRKSMVAAVPITLREAGDASPDNQASMSLISLGTHIADTAKRLEHIKAASAAMKSTMGSVKSILPTDFPSIGVPWLIEAAASLYGKAKVADRIPQVANVVISNVPGPQVPLYLAGARMRTNYPTSIVVHGMALNITVQSFDQSMDFGLMADAKALPDVKELAHAIEISFDDIRSLPLPGEGDASMSAAALVGRASKSITGAVTGAVSGLMNQTVGRAFPKVAKGLVQAAVDQTVRQGAREVVAKATGRSKVGAPGKGGRSR